MKKRELKLIQRAINDLETIALDLEAEKHPTTGNAVAVGSCRFTGDRFAFRLGSQRGGFRVVPALPEPTRSGIFYYKPRSGEGITFHEFVDAEGERKCVAYFFTYRNNQIGSPFNDTWYSCEGVLNDDVYDLTIYETLGKFQSSANVTKPVGVGTLAVQGNVVDFAFVVRGRSEQYTMNEL